MMGSLGSPAWKLQSGLRCSLILQAMLGRLAESLTHWEHTKIRMPCFTAWPSWARLGVNAQKENMRTIVYNRLWKNYKPMENDV
jgi:hypothetical protein